MNYKLNDFYRGKEWIKLKNILMLERVNENGEIICACCGKPIVKAYDCIGHHKQELTQENVNNPEISLNPDMVDLVHHACHNRIHHKLCSVQRNVYLVYGPPLCGKSTWVKEVAERGDLIVDMDNIWQCVSGCSRYDKPDRLTGIVFAVRDCLIDQIKLRCGSWRNAYLIGGYPMQGERERLCKMLGAVEILVECSREECLNRLKICQDGRDMKLWKKYIEDWFRIAPPTLPVNTLKGELLRGWYFPQKVKNEISGFENQENPEKE